MTKYLFPLTTLFSLGLLAFPALAGRADVPVPALAPAVIPAPADFALLQKALVPMGAGGGLKLSSAVVLTGNMSGISVVMHTRLEVVAQRPGQFRITAARVNDQGIAQQKFILVSNGAKVWTYAPGTNRYSVMSLAAFNAGDDVFLMKGLLASFYLDAGKDIASLAQGLNSGDRAATLLDMKKRGITFTRQPPSADSPEEVVYRMAMSKDGYNVYFYTNSRTGQLTRFDLTGTSDGTQIAMREDVTQISSLSSVPKGTFYFMPPSGAVRAAKVSVRP